MVGGTHHDDRRACRVELLREVAADARELLDATDVQPRPAEDRVAFQLEELRCDRVGVVDRAGAEPEVLGPRALGGLGKVRHQQSSFSLRPHYIIGRAKREGSSTKGNARFTAERPLRS
jgi:hypothetical protein